MAADRKRFHFKGHTKGFRAQTQKFKKATYIVVPHESAIDRRGFIYGGPQLSRQNQNPHDKIKNLTAKTKYLTAKPKTSRQNQKPHGKKKIPHGKNKCRHAGFAPMPQHSLREPWAPGFHPPRSVTCVCFCREFLLLPRSICFCREFLLLP